MRNYILRNFLEPVANFLFINCRFVKGLSISTLKKHAIDNFYLNKVNFLLYLPQCYRSNWQRECNHCPATHLPIRWIFSFRDEDWKYLFQYFNFSFYCHPLLSYLTLKRLKAVFNFICKIFTLQYHHSFQYYWLICISYSSHASISSDVIFVSSGL